MRLLHTCLFTLCCLGFILGFGSCASSTACDSTQAPTAQPILLFQKTPCYGTCPAYNATIYADGSIRYKGIRHTPVKGEMQLCLSPKQNKKVQASLRQLDLTSLVNTYLAPYTDMPSSFLTFYEQGTEIKRIKHQQGGPQELQEFITMLDAAITQLVQQQASGSNK